MIISRTIPVSHPFLLAHTFPSLLLAFFVSQQYVIVEYELPSDELSLRFYDMRTLVPVFCVIWNKFRFLKQHTFQLQWILVGFASFYTKSKDTFCFRYTCNQVAFDLRFFLFFFIVHFETAITNGPT